jgi:uncharacterized protein (TIGR02145 family)
MNETKLGFKNLYLPVFILFMGIGVQILISCSSDDGGDTPPNGGSISSSTEDPILYCVVEALSYCVTGLSGKQCRDDGYRGNSGYSDTKCPGGYDIITKVGSSSSFGGQGGISSSIVNIISSSSSIGFNGSSSSIGNVVSSSSSEVSQSSSSSQVQSSSSVSIISSSSSAGANVSSSSNLCTGFVNGTTRMHYGKDKQQFCDERDGNKYVYVTIGSQIWMAENLNYAAQGSKCYNCARYGRLYNWNTAMNNSASSITNPSGVQGVCPAGWHLPSQAEWNDLVNYAGGSSSAGKNLKATSGWDSNDGASGNDNYGFSALPGGYSDYYGYLDYVGYLGIWWSASSDDSSSASYREMSYYNDIALWNYDLKSNLFSVRCLQD